MNGPVGSWSPSYDDGRLPDVRTYTGPPPTGRYGAPAHVPRPIPPWQQVPPPFPPARTSRPTTPRGAPPHDVPQPYLLVMRTRDWAWWRPVLGLLLIAALYGIASLLLVLVVAWTGIVPELQLVDLLQPAVLLVTNASLIIAIPIVWMCWAVAHGLRIGWSSSVLGRLRWRLFRPWTIRALVTVGLAALLVVLLDALVSGGSTSGPDSSFLWLVLVVLTTTPLQAAAEEYVFRGYLSQTLAGWVRAPRAGAVVSAGVTAALFSAAHAPPDLQTFLLRFGFGLAASAAVWLTGGLEAAIAMHAVYNMTLFIVGGAVGTVTQTSSDPGQSLPESPVAVLLLLAGMAGYVVWIARSRSALGVPLLTAALDLRGRPPATPPGWGRVSYAPNGYGPAPQVWSGPPVGPAPYGYQPAPAWWDRQVWGPPP